MNCRTRATLLLVALLLLGQVAVWAAAPAATSSTDEHQ